MSFFAFVYVETHCVRLHCVRLHCVRLYGIHYIYIEARHRRTTETHAVRLYGIYRGTTETHDRDARSASLRIKCGRHEAWHF
ncbi:MAG TPA: hypothetical protein EYP59_04765 [Thiotrichaceae bacterium]|nr:hypothetical protein [Thiotrichaceae bacterium]